MEPGPTIKQEKNDKNKTSNIVSNVGDVLQPLRVRRYSDNTDEIDRFLLRSQFSIILPCGILLWALLLLFG
jgi:hypothetical protein